MVKCHFITYGNSRFAKSRKRIVEEAKKFGTFDTINSYGPENLDMKFIEKFQDILKQPRMGGYELWKPYFVKQRLSEINEGDFLLYMDAGCTLNMKGKKRFQEYLDMLNISDYGIVSFQMPHLEKYWTTKQIFDHFEVDISSDIANFGQIMSTVVIMKKNAHVIKIIDEWYNTVHENALLFTDHYNKHGQISEFRDNRHGQSILSVLRKKHGSILLKDETYFTPFGSDESLKYPFWATRIRK